jgi:hypothetical protein
VPDFCIILTVGYPLILCFLANADNSTAFMDSNRTGRPLVVFFISFAILSYVGLNAVQCPHHSAQNSAMITSLLDGARLGSATVNDSAGIITDGIMKIADISNNTIADMMMFFRVRSRRKLPIYICAWSLLYYITIRTYKKYAPICILYGGVEGME